MNYVAPLDLALDIGNSRISCGLFQNDKLIETFNFDTHTPEEAARQIKNLNANLGSITISSVVPAAREAFLKSLNFPPEKLTLLHPSNQKLIKGVYETMGCDRLANAAAGYRLYGHRAPAIVVVDFGTATTLTAVSNEGQFLGGMITLGLSKTFAALHKATAQLPELSLAQMEINANPLAFDTQEAIERGCVLGHIGLVRHWLSGVRPHLPAGSIAIATGGLAPLIAGWSEVFSEVDVQLTLKGIRILGVAVKHQEDQD